MSLFFCTYFENLHLATAVAAVVVVGVDSSGSTAVVTVVLFLKNFQ